MSLWRALTGPGTVCRHCGRPLDALFIEGMFVYRHSATGLPPCEQAKHAFPRDEGEVLDELSGAAGANP